MSSHHLIFLHMPRREDLFYITNTPTPTPWVPKLLKKIFKSTLNTADIILK